MELFQRLKMMRNDWLYWDAKIRIGSLSETNFIHNII